MRNDFLRTLISLGVGVLGYFSILGIDTPRVTKKES